MCKVSDAIKHLSREEIESLTHLRDGPVRTQMQPGHAIKLMDMGLVELSCGRLAQTALGQRVTRFVQSSSSAAGMSWHRGWHQVAH